jgi:hypothetical protein
MKVSRWFAVILAAVEPFLPHHSIAAEIPRRDYEPPPPRKPGIMQPAGFFGTAYVTHRRLGVSASGTVTEPIT